MTGKRSNNAGECAAGSVDICAGVPEGACIIRNIVLILEHAIILIACSFYMYLVVQPGYPKLMKTKRRYKLKRNVEIVHDIDGKSIVVIHDIRFKGRQNIEWKEVEGFIKEYVGSCYEITETADRIYIGNDFPDEYTGSRDTKGLKGTNAKAKANAAQGIPEIIQIAQNKSFAPNYEEKHKKDAKCGWYRYDTKFAIPVYDETGNISRYNVFSARMLVRHAKDGKLFLYDLLRTKKETGKPLEL